MLKVYVENMTEWINEHPQHLLVGGCVVVGLAIALNLTFTQYFREEADLQDVAHNHASAQLRDLISPEEYNYQSVKYT